MKCPVCTDATLVMSERQGIEIDYCPQCRGVWLDRGELDKIVERSGPQAGSPPSRPAPSYAQHGGAQFVARGAAVPALGARDGAAGRPAERSGGRGQCQKGEQHEQHRLEYRDRKIAL